MKLHSLVLDYDGTIAAGGACDPEVLEAVAFARSRGIVVLLATRKTRADLERVLPQRGAFDGIVAENGAVLYFPSNDLSIVLGQRPPPVFAEELRRRGIPFVAGECLVEADAGHASAILEVVRDLELPLALSFNGTQVMILPLAISKATGLREALRALRLSPHNTVAVGDAENDQDVLTLCELGVAVGWGSAALKAIADEVLDGEGPTAVAAFIRHIVRERRIAPSRIGRRRVQLGICEAGDPLSLAVRGRNVLVAGDTQSGKSWIAGLLCEQLVLHNYCVCIVDPEGEYAGLEALPSVVVLDSDPHPPALKEVERAIRYPDASVIINLSKLKHPEKLEYVRKLLRGLKRLRRRIGLPHRIVVDEAHYFLSDPSVGDLIDLELAGYLLVSYRPSQIHAEVLRGTEAVIVTRTSDAHEAHALRKLYGSDSDSVDWVEVLRSLELGQAALLPGAEESGGEIVRFRASGRITKHVRHREKYVSVPVAPQHCFFFQRKGVSTGRKARTLSEFAEILEGEPVFREHLHNHDFSRWIRGVFADRPLAERVRAIEDGWAEGRVENVHEALASVVSARYLAAGSTGSAGSAE
jgi:hydroxymethylpyrimidine pyrophosphatase-like HAD family hydrolase